MGAQAPRNPKEARDPKINPARNATMPELARVSFPVSGSAAGLIGVHSRRKSWITKKRGPNTENPKIKCPQRCIAGNSAKPLCVTTGQVTKIYSEISIAIFFR